MSQDLQFEGKKYISSKRAAQSCGYTQDYIGQLIRSKKIDARMVGRGWFVSEESINAYKLQADIAQGKMNPGQSLPEVDKSTLYSEVKYFKDETPLLPELKKVDESIVESLPVDSVNAIPVKSISSFVTKELGKKVLAGVFSLAVISGSVWMSDSQHALSALKALSSLASGIGELADMFTDTPNMGAVASIETGNVLKVEGNTTQAQASTSQSIIETTGAPLSYKSNIFSSINIDDLASAVALVSKDLESQIQTLSNSSQLNIRNIRNTAERDVTSTLRLSRIYDSTISNPTISGGTISDTAITATTFSANSLTVTSGTLTNLLFTTASGTDALFTNSTTTNATTTNFATDLLAVSGTLRLDSTNPVVTSNRLYANGTDLYWAGNLIGGATTGNWASDGTHAWRATGNVGIGSSTPWGKLSVASYGGNQPQFVVASSTGSGATTTSFIVDYLGNVGIGSTSPSSVLSIFGNTPATSTAYVMGNSLTAPTIVYPQIQSTLVHTSPQSNSSYANLSLSTEANESVALGALRGINSDLFTRRSTSNNQGTLSGIVSTVSHFGSGTVGTIQGLSVTALASSTNAVTTVTGASIVASNQSLPVGNAASVTNVFGISVSANSGGNLNVASTTDLRAISAGISTQTQQTSNYVNAAHIFRGMYTTNNSYDSKIGSLYGLSLFSNASSQPVTNLYGVYVDSGWNGTPGTIDNYAIYSGPTNAYNYFGGNTGIGSTSPWGKLSISSYGGSQPQFAIASSTGSGATTTSFIVDTFGNIGIGTTSPSSPLEVVTRGQNGLRIINSSDTSATRLDFYSVVSNAATRNWMLRTDTYTYGDFVIMQSDTRLGDPLAGTPRLLVSVSGNVGIGTTSPGQKLSVAGDILGNNIISSYFTSTSSTATSSLAGDLKVTGGITAGTNNIITIGSAGQAMGYVNLATNNNGGVLLSSNLNKRDSTAGLFVVNTHSSLSGAAIHIPGNNDTRQGNIEFWTTPTASVTAGSAYTPSAPRMVIDTTGNVGVGSTTPSGKFSVTGGGTGTGRAFVIGDSLNNERFTLLDNGTVGLGTSSPSDSLDIARGGNIRLWGNARQFLQFFGGGAKKAEIGLDWGNGNFEINATNDNYPILFQTGSTPTTRMTILTGGNVGIGINSPAYKLEVNGSASTTLLNLPNTNSSSVGGIYMGGSVYMHNYGANNNFFLGAAAGNFTLSGGNGDNLAIGRVALQSLTSGGRNTSIGQSSGNSLSSGGSNILIGYRAGTNITEGNSNVVIGTNVGNGNDIGAGSSGDNTIINTSTGLSGNSSYNVSIGQSGNANMTDTSNNILIGRGTGGSLTTGSNNVMLGIFAGSAAATSASGNVMLGYYAGRYETGGDSFYVNNRNLTTNAAERTASLIYGTFNSTAPNQTLTLNASTSIAQNLNVHGTGNNHFAGNVGISTTSPSAKLSVTGSGTGTGRAFAIANSSDAEKLSVLDNGNISAVGTLTQVASQSGDYTNILRNTNTGSSARSYTQYITEGGASYVVGIANDNYSGTGSFQAGTGYLWQNGPGGISITTTNASAPIKFYTAGETASNERLRITSAGNVGIGSTTPGHNLAIYSASASDDTVISLENTNNSRSKYISFIAGNEERAVVGSQGSSGNNLITTDGLAYSAVLGSRAGYAVQLFTGTTARLTVAGGGNVGIGTTTPVAKLVVSGSSSANTIAEFTNVNTGAWGAYISTGSTNTSRAPLLVQYANTGGQFGQGTTVLGAWDNGNVTVGNVGTTPNTAKLYVKGAGASTGVTFQTADSSGNALFTALDNGNVGIGTTSPLAKLAVKGDGTTTGLAFHTTNSNGIPKFTVQDNGYTGILATSPTRPLEIGGLTGGVNSGIALQEVGGTNIKGTIAVNGSTNDLLIANTANVRFYAGSTIGDVVTLPTNERMVINSSGNVGIGTTTPGSTLSVSGNTFIAGNLTATGTALFMPTTDSTTAFRVLDSIGVEALIADTTTDQVTIGKGGLKVKRTDNASYGVMTYSTNGLFVFDSGLRTASNVIYENSTLASNFTLGAYEHTLNTASQPVNSSINSFTVNGGVYGPTLNGYTKNVIYATTTVSGAGQNTTRGLYSVVSDSSSSVANTIIGIGTDVSGGSNASANRYAAILLGGNVGIGTSSPVSTLSVQGSLCVRDTGSCGTTAGTIYATTASITDIDLAENYPTLDDTLSAGEIVSLDTTAGTTIKRAEQGDTVIGIISTAPGLLLGKELSNSKPVALSGRVPVKVNGENGNISIGDRIALSSTPGVGRKANGSEEVVGTALEAWIGGPLDQGYVTIFVSTKQHFDNNSFSIDANGNMGVGTTTPGYKLQVMGDIAATSFVNISTRDAKHDISYLNTTEKASILDRIKTIGIAQYRYNTESESNPLRLGLIAEEAPTEILAVGGKGVDVYKLSTFILAGVQKMQSVIEELQLSVDTINSRLDSVEGRLASLETFAETGGFGSTGSTTVSGFLASVGVAVDLVSSRITALFADSLSANFVVINNTLSVQTVQASTISTSELRVGTSTNPSVSGITTFDRVTGQPVCMFVSNGVMQSQTGECGVLQPVVNGGTTVTTENTTVVSPVVTPPETEASTTPPEVPVTTETTVVSSEPEVTTETPVVSPETSVTPEPVVETPVTPTETAPSPEPVPEVTPSETP